MDPPNADKGLGPMRPKLTKGGGLWLSLKPKGADALGEGGGDFGRRVGHAGLREGVEELREVDGDRNRRFRRMPNSSAIRIGDFDACLIRG